MPEMDSSIQRLLLTDRQLGISGGGDLAARARALLTQQMARWPLLREGYEGLTQVRTRSIVLDDCLVQLQYNPQRLRSSSARVDEESLRARKCFLCVHHLPAEQRGILFAGEYLVLCNPYPFFHEHFTISLTHHRPQRIGHSLGTLLDLARSMQSRYTLLYNGPRCGASAPDHLHFQAGEKGALPIEEDVERLLPFGDRLAAHTTLQAVALRRGPRQFFLLRSAERERLQVAFALVMSTLAEATGQQEEPMVNLLVWSESHRWTLLVFPRRKHRPSFYFAEGEDRLLLSPAAVDCGGLCIVPLEKDFLRISAELLRDMFAEILLSAEDFASVSSRLRDALATR